MKAKSKAKRARDAAYWSEVAFLSFTEDLLRIMGEDVSQAELARRVGVSRGYISRVFRGTENLTLETMTKLAIAVGASVRVHVAPQDRVTRWTDVPGVSDVVDEALLRLNGTSERERATKKVLAEPHAGKARHHK